MPPDPATEPTAPLPPVSGRVAPVDDVFEHYRVLRREDGSLWELGRGSMGVTYKAIDTNLDKQVALKVINAQFLDKESARERFRREARGAASLDHRNVARVYHLGQSGGTFFYAMEYVGGNTVEDIIKRDGPLPWRNALGIILQIARALIAVHAQNLVHRDIKPANIMVVDEVDEKNVAKLIDFGLAKSAAEEEGASHALSRASGFLGTPLYASPEQCEELPADIRSDIYSLGVTLWYLLTGHPTFEGNLARVFDLQLHGAPPFEKLPADLPPGVRALLEGMLAKDRDKRPQTPTDLRQRIEECLQTPANVAPGRPEERRVKSKPPVLIVKTRQLAPPKPPPASTVPPKVTASPAVPRRFPVWLASGLGAGLLAAAVLWAGVHWLTRRPPPPAEAGTETVTPPPSPPSVVTTTATPTPTRPAVAEASPPPTAPPPATPPASLKELLARARAVGKTSNHAETINAYNAVLAAAPNSVEAWVETGRACEALHLDDKARAAMQRAITIPPADPRDSCYIGTAYLMLNQPDSARRAFTAGLNFAPQGARDHVLQGVAHYWLKQFDRALQDFNEVIRLEPGNATAYDDRAYIYDTMGKNDLAMQDYGRSLRLDPESARAFCNRALLHCKLQQYEPAIQDFNDALRLDPKYAYALQNRGTAYNQLKQFRRAIQDFDAALGLNPNVADTYNARGFAYGSLKQYAAAIQDFNRAIALNAGNPLYYENRAFAEAASGYNTAADSDQAKARHLRLQ